MCANVKNKKLINKVRQIIKNSINFITDYILHLYLSLLYTNNVFKKFLILLFFDYLSYRLFYIYI